MKKQKPKRLTLAEIHELAKKFGAEQNPPFSEAEIAGLVFYAALFCDYIDWRKENKKNLEIKLWV